MTPKHSSRLLPQSNNPFFSMILHSKWVLDWERIIHKFNNFKHKNWRQMIIKVLKLLNPCWCSRSCLRTLAINKWFSKQLQSEMLKVCTRLLRIQTIPYCLSTFSSLSKLWLARLWIIKVSSHISSNSSRPSSLYLYKRLLALHINPTCLFRPQFKQ